MSIVLFHQLYLLLPFFFLMSLQCLVIKEHLGGQKSVGQLVKKTPKKITTHYYHLIKNQYLVISCQLIELASTSAFPAQLSAVQLSN